MDKEDLKEALGHVEHAHALVWSAFDPSGTHGGEKQPKEIKAALKLMREYLGRHDKVLAGFKRGE